MNRIVKEHYPAAKLPDDLRVGMDPDDRVTVTVVTEPPAVERSRGKRSLFGAAKSRDTSIEEAVARIRALRQEWN